MGCTSQFFAEDLPQHSLIDRLQGLSKVKPQSSVDHGLTTAASAVGKISRLTRDIGIE